MVDDHRPRFCRADGVRERQTRVVRYGVEVARPAEQALGAQSRLVRENPFAAQSSVPLDISKQRERIIKKESGAELPSRDPCASIYRPREGQRSDEVWSQPKEPVSLRARLEDEMHMPVLEI